MIMPLDQDGVRQIKAWPVFAWCLPALLGFALFLGSFPIDRRIPFWPHLNLAELYAAWFFFITPFTTGVAIVALVKRRRRGRIPLFPQFLSWTAITLSLVVNLLVLVGMWASTY
jgi:hypothetical protein